MPNSPIQKDKENKLYLLKLRLGYYEDKLKEKLRGYRGVVHESAVSELRHSEVMVISAMVMGIKEEIKKLEDE
jgi:hypothetical protein